jgi:hypothetical protein
MEAVADVVVGETDTDDNSHVDGGVFVTVRGDVNGDRVCDMADISLLIDHFLEEW